MAAPSSSQDNLPAVLAFQRRTHELLSSEVREIEQGWVIRSFEWPAAWMLNHVRITSEISYEEAVALSREHLSDANFDQLYLDHQTVGPKLAERFRQEGWEVDVEVHSVLIGEPDRRADTRAVIEPGEDEALALMQRWIAEDETLRLTEDELRQLVEANRRTWRARDAQRLGIRGSAGELVAIAMLFSEDSVAQVEDVYVIPEARGQGHGRALVSRAIDLAGAPAHELTFIVADDNDWPKQLYGKLGFQPVGRSWLFHRDRQS